MIKRELKLEFANIINRLSGKDYVTCIIAFGVAPTLQELKPSCILTLKKQSKNVYSIWNQYKEEICHELELEFYELAKRPDSTTVLFYKRECLDKHLKEVKNEIYLDELGYCKKLNFHDKLRLLELRYATTCPHEMGIFLGIPVEDVCGFVKHQGKNCILCRYWKVYHDPLEAQRKFENFDCAKKMVIQELIKQYNIA